jgi:hypothetical protein
MRLPQRIIQEIREQMPSTHEIGGHLLAGGGGVIEQFRVYKGKPCRNEKGERFRNTHCKIRKPDHALSFHTHPKSNRPSSSDLRNAVLKHPELGRRGRRRLSVLFTPAGLWHYAPRAALRRRWAGRGPGDPLVVAQMRRWSALGRRLVDRGERYRRYCRHLAADGMDVRFTPYGQLSADGYQLPTPA